MTTEQMIGLSGFAVGIPVLLGWCKWRLWEWQADRERP